MSKRLSRFDLLIPLLRKDKRLPHLVKLWMIFFIDLLRESNVSDMSYRDYERETGISPGSISDSILPALEKAGYIRSGKLPGQSGGSIFLNDVPTESHWRQINDSTMEYDLPEATVTITIEKKPVT